MVALLVALVIYWITLENSDNGGSLDIGGFSIGGGSLVMALVEATYLVEFGVLVVILALTLVIVTLVMAEVTLVFMFVVVSNSNDVNEINGTRVIRDNAYSYTSAIGCINIGSGENLDNSENGGSAINISWGVGDINVVTLICLIVLINYLHIGININTIFNFIVCPTVTDQWMNSYYDWDF